MSDKSFDQGLAVEGLRDQSAALFLIKIICEHISCVEVIVVDVICKLSLAVLVINLPSPDLQCNDKALSEIVDHDVHALIVSYAALDVVVAGAVDDPPYADLQCKAGVLDI